MLMEFLKDFKGAAQILEKGGYTQFTPHYITCSGYDGKDVVVENLRQLCVFKVAKEAKKPWVWWDYVTDFQIRCPMKEKKYNKECAEAVIRSHGLDIKKIENCMGNPDADTDKIIGKGSRGDVTILPTLVINNRQYRGKLEKVAVLKAICSSFEETMEPAICLSNDKHIKPIIAYCIDVKPLVLQIFFWTIDEVEWSTMFTSFKSWVQQLSWQIYKDLKCLHACLYT
ncbi:hypothetical protein K1719_009338 [Acacia pycnantha]|nr:hypothetical protein K1719_009338 [Acacia pycnantha]